MVHQAGAYPGFSNIKQLGVFLSSLDVMLVHRRVTRSMKIAGIHLYTGGERHCESSVLSKNTTQRPQPGLKPRPFDPESSALITSPPPEGILHLKSSLFSFSFYIHLFNSQTGPLFAEGFHLDS